MCRLKNIAGILIFLVVMVTITNADDRILRFRELTFSKWDLNVTYISSSHYDARGMAPLYNITNIVLSIFYNDHPIPDGYIKVYENKIALDYKVQNNEWNDLLLQYWSILLVCCVCLLIIILMPLIGLFLCCCRCAGKCGGRSQPFDKKHDTCRRVMLGLSMITIATGLIFGVVVAFATNSYFHQGIENVTLVARHGVDDTQKFLKSTSLQANHLLVTNYHELSIHLEKILKDTSFIIFNKLEEEANYTSLTQMTTFVAMLPEMKNDLTRIKIITNELRVNASQLSDGLRQVKRELLTALTKCKAKPCKNVLDDYEIGKLDLKYVDYNMVPDLTSTITNLNELISDDIIRPIHEGKHKFDKIRQEISETIDDNIGNIKTAINETGIAIKTASDEITKTFEKISDVTGNNSYKYFDTADFYLSAHMKYTYIAGIVTSSILLVILLCVVLGLFCGICGKRPDGYGGDCCNKGSGARFLMIGVALIFLTISLLTVFVLIFFIGGLILHRGLCIPLQDVENDQIFGYVDELVNLNKVLYPRDLTRRNGGKSRQLLDDLPAFHISDVITSCHKNESIYNVLKLENIMNIEELRNYTNKYGIDVKLEKLIAGVELQSDILILSPKAEEAIKSLRNSEIKDFSAYKFTDNLRDEVTTYNLNEIAEKLEQTAAEITGNAEMQEIKSSLKNQALHLRTYQDKLATPMVEQIRETLGLAQNMEINLKFNRSSFEEAIDSLLLEIKNAQNYINKEGTEFLQKLVRELVTIFKDEIISYLNLVVDGTKTDLGKCGPLSNVYDSAVVTVCNRVVDPFNGFWIGVGWCVLIFLPTIVLSVKLSTLYQKSDPYPGPLVESEYMYDAYSERDNIPLANGSKNKRKKKHERRRSSRDRRGDYYEDTSSPNGPSNGQRDARYNDMAPNGDTKSLEVIQRSATATTTIVDDDPVFTVLPSHLPPSPTKYCRDSREIPKSLINNAYS